MLPTSICYDTKKKKGTLEVVAFQRKLGRKKNQRCDGSKSKYHCILLLDFVFIQKITQSGWQDNREHGLSINGRIDSPDRLTRF